MPDAVVIGAGIAGLVAAREIQRRGASVVVLEAALKVGGRVRTLRLADEPPVELGAQIVHGAGRARHAVCDAGLRIARLDETPELVFGVDGRAHAARELLAAGLRPPWALEADLAQDDPPDLPLAELLAQRGLPALERVLGLEWMRQVWGADATQLSAAWVARLARAGLSTAGAFVVLDGFDRLAAHLAEPLDVRLGCPVRTVHWSPRRVRADADGMALQARTAVVAVPPTVVAGGRLRFDPPLPAPKACAARALRLGDASTVVARLAEPATRSVTGLMVGELGGFWRARKGSRLLVGSLKGPPARRVPPAGDGELVEHLTGPLFPWLRAATVEAVEVVRWHAEPFLEGGPGYPAVGASDAPAVWRAPLEPTVFFAGEATCLDACPPRIDGALHSGVRAAGQAMAALEG